MILFNFIETKAIGKLYFLITEVNEYKKNYLYFLKNTLSTCEKYRLGIRLEMDMKQKSRIVNDGSMKA